MTGNGSGLGKQYMGFVRGNMDQVQKKITDDLWVVAAMEHWYAEQVQMLCHWLTERLDRSLHPYQCTCLAHIVKVRTAGCDELAIHLSTSTITKCIKTINQGLTTPDPRSNISLLFSF